MVTRLATGRRLIGHLPRTRRPLVSGILPEAAKDLNDVFQRYFDQGVSRGQNKIR